jgi:serine/threonine protein kinase/Flp pilus assembly protein TadD
MANQHLGPYRILREIGHGGMGTVYLAERDDRQFKKQVALKVLRSGSSAPTLYSDMIVRRFRQERQILASLEHPNIARLLDGGATHDGMPYLVLEYVEGQPLNDYCDQRQLSLRERLQVFRTVCAAVHYAHQNLVVHRDLKPSNILITPEGTPKLLDFGIAKILNPETFDQLMEQPVDQTLSSVRLMTPAYASPEQVRGETITTASDVYALGVVLYELLTGHRPYQFSSSALHDTARVICEVEPPKPSAIVTRAETITGSEGRPKATITPAEVSRARKEAPEKLRRQLAGDLDNIVLKALRKEPQRRYASVEQLSEDLRRYLDGLPVRASRDTFTYRSTKFLRRHRAGVAAVTLIALALIVGTGFAVWQARIAARQRDVARLEKAKAESVNVFLQELLAFSNPEMYLPNTQKGRETTVKDVLDATGPLIERELANQPEVRTAIQRTIGTSYVGLGQYELAENYLQQALESNLRLYGEDHPETVRCLASLAGVLSNKADSSSVIPLYQRLIPIYRRQQQAGTVNASELAQVLNDYSVLVRLKGDLKGAETLLREALALTANLPSKFRAVSAYIKLNLALVRADQGGLAEAVQMNRAAVSEYRQIQGRERFELGMSLTALGDELTIMNQLAEAESALHEGEAIFRKLIAEAHPAFATNLCFQAYLCYRKGEYIEAEKTIRKSLELYRQAGAKAHQHYVTALTTLGLILNLTGRTAEAESTLREALNIRIKFFPKGHHKTALTMGALGECLTTQKRHAEAEELLLTSYQDLKATQGEQNPRTVEALQRVIELYDAWGKLDQTARFRQLLPQKQI